MKKPAIIQVLSNRPIAYHKEFRRISGRTVAGIFLSQLFYWSDKGSDPDGWIWKTLEDWEDETGLSYSEQRTARKHLIQRKLIEEELRGIPAQLYYRILWDNVLSAIMALYEEQEEPVSNGDKGSEHDAPESEHESPTLPTAQPATEASQKQGLENLKTKGKRTLKTLITENTSREYKTSCSSSEQPSLPIGQEQIPEGWRKIEESPHPSKRVSPLMPQEPYELALFERLQANAAARGRRKPQRFPSLECKEKLARVAEKLDGRFEEALIITLEQGHLAVTTVVNYMAGIAKRWAESDKPTPRVIRLGDI